VNILTEDNFIEHFKRWGLVEGRDYIKLSNTQIMLLDKDKQPCAVMAFKDTLLDKS
jgi:hypothetical protein